MENNIRLPRYITIPVSLLGMGLSDLTMIVYGFLLNRYTLSRKNGWSDENGKTYILYPVEELGADIGKTARTAMRAMHELEKHGLIRVKRRGYKSANMIYVSVPAEMTGDRNDTYRPDRTVTSDLTETSPQTCQKCHPNNMKNNLNNNTSPNTANTNPSYNSPNGGRRGQNRNRKDTGSSMFAPIPDYENCDYGYGY